MNYLELREALSALSHDYRQGLMTLAEYRIKRAAINGEYAAHQAARRAALPAARAAQTHAATLVKQDRATGRKLALAAQNEFPRFEIPAEVNAAALTYALEFLADWDRCQGIACVRRVENGHIVAYRVGETDTSGQSETPSS